MQANPISVVICAGSFAVLGLGFAALGRYLLRSARHLARHGVRVPGEVVGMRHSSGADVGSGSYYPILRFRTVDGRDVETSTDIGTDPAPAHEGDQVTVIYDPADPRTARIDSLLGRGTGIGWTLVVGGGGFAVISALLGVALLV